MVHTLRKRPLGSDGTPVEITTKDFLLLVLIVPREADCLAFCESIVQLTTLCMISEYDSFDFGFQ